MMARRDPNGPRCNTAALDAVRQAWEADADPALVQRIARLVADGKAEWAWDPYLVGVAGVVLTGTNDALIVTYPDGDWEESIDPMPGVKFR